MLSLFLVEKAIKKEVQLEKILQKPFRPSTFSFFKENIWAFVFLLFSLILGLTIYFSSSRETIALDNELFFSFSPYMFTKEFDNIEYWKIKKLNYLPLFVMEKKNDSYILKKEQEIETSFLINESIRIIKDEKIEYDFTKGNENFTAVIKQIKEKLRKELKEEKESLLLFNYDYLFINLHLYCRCMQILNKIKEINFKKGINIPFDLFEGISNKALNAIFKITNNSSNTNFIKSIKNSISETLSDANIQLKLFKAKGI